MLWGLGKAPFQGCAPIGGLRVHDVQLALSIVRNTCHYYWDFVHLDILQVVSHLQKNYQWGDIGLPNPIAIREHLTRFVGESRPLWEQFARDVWSTGSRMG